MFWIILYLLYSQYVIFQKMCVIAYISASKIPAWIKLDISLVNWRSASISVLMTWHWHEIAAKASGEYIKLFLGWCDEPIAGLVYYKKRTCLLPKCWEITWLMLYSWLFCNIHVTRDLNCNFDVFISGEIWFMVWYCNMELLLSHMLKKCWIQN